MTNITLIASGDLRESANITCWPAQAEMEALLADVLSNKGHQIIRAHPIKPQGHGFIASQKEGMKVFENIDPNAPLIVAEAVWQYSHHVLAGLVSHKGPILTIANWSGQWPGLVGLLNLNGSLTKAGVKFSTLWSENFDDEFFLNGLDAWLKTGEIQHDLSHLRAFNADTLSDENVKLATKIATNLQTRKSIMGVFDEGCMGMYNAIIPDELLMPLGVYKERLSQSSLYYAASQVDENEAQQVLNWLIERGLQFKFGTNHETDLTKEQVIGQCRMYIAVVRLAEEFGCESVGIQYQQGLKDLMPASDLVEGMLNNDDRPDVMGEDGLIRSGQAIVHFNEVDECAGLDGILTNRVHRALNQPVENTLHDLRWGDYDQDGYHKDFIWVFEISGAVPPSHNIGGWAGSQSLRQPAMYFPSGGGTLRGIAKPGEIIWSRIFVENNALHMDIGRAQSVSLSNKESARRSNATTPEWPMMHCVLNGVTRNQMMARHRANHIQVAYANSADEADQVVAVKAELARQLGISVNLCGI